MITILLPSEAVPFMKCFYEAVSKVTDTAFFIVEGIDGVHYG